MAHTEVKGRGLGQPTLVLADSEHTNWEIFEYNGDLWTLSVNRDGEVHLIPSDSIPEAPDVPQDEWVEFEPDEFGEKLGNEIIYRPDESPLNSS